MFFEIFLGAWTSKKSPEDRLIIDACKTSAPKQLTTPKQLLLFQPQGPTCTAARSGMKIGLQATVGRSLRRQGRAWEAGA